MDCEWIADLSFVILGYCSLRYHGEKLSTFCPKQKKPRYYISTVYDEPKEEDMGDTLLRRQPSTTLKHRNNPMSSL